MFVLGKEIPKDFIIDFSKKGIQELKNAKKQNDNLNSNNNQLKLSQDATHSSNPRDFYGLRSNYIATTSMTNSVTNERLDGSEHKFMMLQENKISSRNSFQMEGGSNSIDESSNAVSNNHQTKQVKFADASPINAENRGGIGMGRPKNPVRGSEGESKASGGGSFH